MKHFFIFALSLSFAFSASAQDCDCPTDQNNDNDSKPYRVFSFSNGKQLGICGYSTVEVGDTTFTRFVLYHCDDSRAIKEWGKTKSSKISKVKDTLVIQDMFGLPVGQSFSTLWRPFFIHKYYFKDGELKESTSFSRAIPKYSKAQIAQVLQEYNGLSKDAPGSILRVSKMLFWAYASGSKEAEAYLKTIPDKFGPFDSAIAEEWNDTYAFYELWREKNQK